ncbi:hypothetical protein BBL81_04905 [Vibrio parahaemolyticus]|uniref:tetratricopeptide repeat protein n=1 Tax=Vibrio parahaemolyticus TaxID=670 RepID=UPI00084AB9C5|nr:tetratricopeptide repeat protein [Vibrio parahaemolyticus]ODW12900.1 hypothetical protein BBL80_14975 [Vibrio parahaemolyticus]ODW29331.1 hypothetical protein BBL81_04905 [Vibrio parahaemolyticus]
MNEYLDICRHGTHEYEGKTVELDGGEYRVGKRIGNGAERVVHTLINKKSGLSYNVIKIWPGLAKISSDQTFTSLALAGVQVAMTVTVNEYGGWFDLQESLCSMVIEYNDIEEVSNKAVQAAQEGNSDEAIHLFQEALEINPDHTIVLSNFAKFLWEQGEREQALSMMLHAVSVEPLWPRGQIEVSSMAASLGQSGIARQVLKRLYHRYSEVPFWDEQAFELLEFVDDPELALSIISQRLAVLDGDGIHLCKYTEQHKRFEQHSWRKGKALELAYLSQKDGTTPDERLRLLAEAYETSPRTPIVAANYGVALVEQKPSTKAEELLVSAAYAMSPTAADACFSASAVSALLRGDIERAEVFASTLLQHLSREGDEPNALDVPGLPHWISDEYVLASKIAPLLSRLEQGGVFEKLMVGENRATTALVDLLRKAAMIIG